MTIDQEMTSNVVKIDEDPDLFHRILVYLYTKKYDMQDNVTNKNKTFSSAMLDNGETLEPAAEGSTLSEEDLLATLPPTLEERVAREVAILAFEYSYGKATLTALNRVGFFYSYQKNCAPLFKCQCCNLEVLYTAIRENPAAHHARWSPQCGLAHRLCTTPQIARAWVIADKYGMDDLLQRTTELITQTLVPDNNCCAMHILESADIIYASTSNEAKHHSEIRKITRNALRSILSELEHAQVEAKIDELMVSYPELGAEMFKLVGKDEGKTVSERMKKEAMQRVEENVKKERQAN